MIVKNHRHVISRLLYNLATSLYQHRKVLSTSPHTGISITIHPSTVLHPSKDGFLIIKKHHDRHIIRRLLYGLATSTDVMEEEEELELETLPEEEIHRFSSPSESPSASQFKS